MAKNTVIVTCVALVLGAGVGWWVASRQRTTDSGAAEGGAASRRVPAPEGTETTPRLGGVRDPQDLANRVRELERENADLRERAAQAEQHAQERLFALPPDADTIAVAQLGPETDAADGGLLQCYVFDRHGRPQSGTKLTLFRPPAAGRQAATWNLETDADGRAEAGPFPAATYQLQLTFPQGTWYRDVALRPGRTYVVRFWVWGEDAGTVRGRVTRYGGSPVPDARVYLSPHGRGARPHYQTRTDDEGRYACEGVPAGRASVSASLPLGSRSVWHEIDVPSRGEVEQDFVLGVPTLHGTITDTTTGLPIEGVRLLLDDGHGGQQEFRSDASGTYAFADVSAGRYSLGVFRDGYGSGWRHGIEVGTEERRLDLDLRPAAVLVLRVRKPDGDPYTGGLYLGMTPAGDGLGERGYANLEADEHGVAVYRRIVPGRYELRISVNRGIGAPRTPREEATLTVIVAPGENEIRVPLEQK